jgi:hypothetical protein
MYRYPTFHIYYFSEAIIFLHSHSTIIATEITKKKRLDKHKKWWKVAKISLLEEEEVSMHVWVEEDMTKFGKKKKSACVCLCVG